MVKVLITRPKGSSEHFARTLRSQGYESVIEPLLAVEPLGGDMPRMTNVDAVMITSGNALDALEADGENIRDLFTLPCFCVGPRTAARAAAFGFQNVRNTEGDGAELARLIGSVMGQGGSTLHIAGHDADRKAQGELERLGHKVVTWVVYAASPVTQLTQATVELLKQGGLDAVTVFSVRTAEALKALLAENALLACCEALTAIGLSEAVLEALKPLPWRHRVAAAQPTEDAVIECLKQLHPVSPR